MKIGVVLPTFRDDPAEALETAATAAKLGLDGVFAYDHLYPMGSPERPALAPFPILARVAVAHPALFVGTLVARIGLVATEVLVAQFDALDALSPGHVICAAGTGDRLSAEENVAWGVPVASPDERRADLEAMARTLLGRGREVWIGGGAAKTLAMAEAVGATVNLWGASPEQVFEQAKHTAVSWAGPMPAGDGAPDLGGLLAALAEAGATWAVLGGVVDLERLAEVSER